MGFAFAAVAALVLSAPAQGDGPEADALSEPAAVQRVAIAARAWGQVRYRHPWFLSRDVDWDGAFVRALPRFEAAQTPGAFAAALSGMLAELKDPVTGLAAAPAPARPHRASELLSTRDDTLVIRPGADGAGQVDRKAMLAALSRAGSVVLDLRRTGGDDLRRHVIGQLVDSVVPLLVTRTITAPAAREVMHDGYAPQLGPESGGFSSALLTIPGTAFQPMGDHRDRKLLVIVDGHSVLPASAVALLSSGAAQVISEGAPPELATVETVALTPELWLNVRVREIPATLHPAATLPASAEGDAEDAIDEAVQLLHDPERPAPALELKPLQPRWAADARYEETPTPDRAHRILAAVRFWNVIDLFHPQKELLKVRWADVLPRALSDFATAATAEQYRASVLQMAALLEDGAVQVTKADGSLFVDPAGTADGVAPFDVQEIEGRPVITSIRSPELAPQLQVGDVIETVDGAPVEARMKRLEPYVSASNAPARRSRLISAALRGTAGRQGTVTVRGGSGGPRTITFTRTDAPPVSKERFKLLPAGIGYVDLRAIEVADVAGMFEKLLTARAIVFDLRGPPKQAGPFIAARLGAAGPKVAAILERCVARGGDAGGRARRSSSLSSEGGLYGGRTALLIDERTAGEAENTALLFRAAAKSALVGSRSAGSGGDATVLSLPGGLFVRFTGDEVRFPDGTQLQRVGLAPEVEARPTLAGIRAGRDEVLERAMEYLKTPVHASAGGH